MFVKKIKNLLKYIMKEKNFIINLIKEELDIIGKWKMKVKDVEWGFKLDEYCKKFSIDLVDFLIKVQYNVYQYSDYLKLSVFLFYMLDFYKVNNRRLFRVILQYLVWKYGYMLNNYLIDKWF